jgi:hypothetical protein
MRNLTDGEKIQVYGGGGKGHGKTKSRGGEGAGGGSGSKQGSSVHCFDNGASSNGSSSGHTGCGCGQVFPP